MKDFRAADTLETDRANARVSDETLQRTHALLRQRLIGAWRGPEAPPEPFGGHVRGDLGLTALEWYAVLTELATRRSLDRARWKRIFWLLLGASSGRTGCGRSDLAGAMSAGKPAEMIEAPTIQICPSHWADAIRGLSEFHAQGSADACGIVHSHCVAQAFRASLAVREAGRMAPTVIGCPVCFAQERGIPNVVEGAVDVIRRML